MSKVSGKSGKSVCTLLQACGTLGSAPGRVTELRRMPSGQAALLLCRAGGAFFDAGVLSQNYSKLTSASIEAAVGLGLRLDLPIGPVRLEYAYNLTRNPGEPVGTFHFAIGFGY